MPGILLVIVGIISLSFSLVDIIVSSLFVCESEEQLKNSLPLFSC